MVNVDMLDWAMTRASLQREALASRLQVQPEQVSRWFERKEAPTFAQARRAAAVLSIPFGYLYLSAPPEEELPIPDLRTVGGERGGVSLNLLSLLSDIQFKRDWYREYRIRNGETALPFVGKFSLRDAPPTIAQDMSAVLFGGSGRPTKGGFEDYLQAIMLKAEEVGIWVMRTGIVGNNTHRPLAVSEFRGLAIADDIAPLVLINGQDSKSAQIFTLAHELAHIWVGSSDISTAEITEAGRDDGHRRVEHHCNQIAAEFLAPTIEFREAWRGDIQFEDQVDALAQRFKVSRIVVARKALQLGYLDRPAYESFYNAERERWRDLNRDSGGDFFRTLPVRNGRRFTRAVVNEAISGRLLLRHAGSLLGVQPGKVRTMYQRLAY